ncbi:hypothetical protein [Bacillus pseudomycoides]|uniref:Group-specific protein n=1 Tax=Bacillus pseudomycoides TaxID=64104 RepID=A0A2B6K4D8_9BACI|nr:hypothetical protein [Bacillus pseudomycoides]PDY49107.1 hypothetical protein CON79_01550 [Bacillus pseudomycoides]PED09772.1 hypothetical protein COO19_01970 [Bacillus pseudomycoides]PED72921.1 hypothetical protein CON97_06245 [Bacillus pseudomycoides]PEI45130.1 hypothetical protein CN620_03445 [Bacillus pseudomycoides]PEI99219.1 hypothetical protein CN686_03190 [Bacillus pseudomycoides]
MNLEQGWETSFLEVIQKSEFKKGALRSQLLCMNGEEVEEIVDDYGYEEIVNREHDEELAEILGEELFGEMERYVFLSSQPEKKLISFVNGLGFHILDWIVLLETEFGIDSAVFSSDAVKMLEKRFRQFPYIEDKTIFDMTIGEAMDVLGSVTGLQLKEKMSI